MASTHAQEARFIVRASTASFENATSMSAASKYLLEGGFHAPAASLAILALEEVGKMIIIDGLLFARADDERSAHFRKGARSHDAKLMAMIVFPFFLQQLATLDDRYDQPAFKQTLAVTVFQYEQARRALAPWIGPACALTDLDPLKQKGFYAHQVGGDFQTPAALVTPDCAAAVVALAWRVVDALGFFFRKHLRGYEDRIRSLRQISVEDLGRIRAEAEGLVANMFGSDPSVH